jgi:hypothetical protein
MIPSSKLFLRALIGAFCLGVSISGLYAQEKPVSVDDLPPIEALPTEEPQAPEPSPTPKPSPTAVTPADRQPTSVNDTSKQPPPPAQTPPATGTETAGGLRGGVPPAWLIGEVFKGRCGVSRYGLDTERVLRANPEQPYFGGQLNKSGSPATWRSATPNPNGLTMVEPSTEDYTWFWGAGYAQVYVRADKPTRIVLHWMQTGFKTAGWLDGKPVAFSADPKVPADFPKPGQRPTGPLEGTTVEGLKVMAMPEKAEPPQAATLELAPGWHVLLVKMAVQTKKGDSFYFAAKFTDADGRPVEGLQTQLQDPTADLALNAQASKFKPITFVDAPANLPRRGEPVRVEIDMDWHPLDRDKTKPAITPFEATLRMVMVDYEGKDVTSKEVKGSFPGKVKLDMGVAGPPGYYALYPSLWSKEGKLIMNYRADGFTVVPGNAAQRQRLAKKKLWNNNYYVFTEDISGKGMYKPGDQLRWLERSGVLSGLGSFPGSPAMHPATAAKWDEAKKLGLRMFADFGGDSPWLGAKPEETAKMVAAAAPYTKFFKSINEIDIRRSKDFAKMHNPAAWVERSKREAEAVRKIGGHYIGGSLVTPNRGEGGKWLAQCLKLGLEDHVDAWDVHSYPRFPVRFDGPFGNDPGENDVGVNNAFKAAGKTNKLPFWEGETGAFVDYDLTGGRGQAERTAKMIAWINARADYKGIAFCIGNEYDFGYGRLWGYNMGHKPAEAAMVTASALIDGMPYREVKMPDRKIQAGYFGTALMIWRDDDATENYPFKVPPGKPWVMVDVVGNVRALQVDRATGVANLALTSSPLYLLPAADYTALTR